MREVCCGRGLLFVVRGVCPCAVLQSALWLNSRTLQGVVRMVLKTNRRKNADGLAKSTSNAKVTIAGVAGVAKGKLQVRPYLSVPRPRPKRRPV